MCLNYIKINFFNLIYNINLYCCPIFTEPKKQKEKLD